MATIEVQTTSTFDRWFAALRDQTVVRAVDRRVGRLRQGNFGDSKSVGDGVSELRLDLGQGYRIYFTRQGNVIVILLCGGDKSSQERDIDRAKSLALAYRSA